MTAPNCWPSTCSGVCFSFSNLLGRHQPLPSCRHPEQQVSHRSLPIQTEDNDDIYRAVLFFIFLFWAASVSKSPSNDLYNEGQAMNYRDGPSLYGLTHAISIGQPY